VQSVFVVSNTAGLTGSSLSDSTASEELAVAYNSFLETVFRVEFPPPTATDAASEENRIRKLQEVLTLVENSGRIESYTEEDCPDTAFDGSICHTCAALFQLEISGTDDNNSAVERVKTAVQSRINQGELGCIFRSFAGSRVLTLETGTFADCPSLFPSQAPSSPS